jgi:hypothetical protein
MGRLRYAWRLLGELWAFARANRVWWILPLVLALGLLALVVAASQTAAPFIYTLF